MMVSEGRRGLDEKFVHLLSTVYHCECRGNRAGLGRAELGVQMTEIAGHGNFLVE